MKNKHCNDCGYLVEYDSRVCEDYNIDINDDFEVVCSECYNSIVIKIISQNLNYFDDSLIKAITIKKNKEIK